MSMEEIYVAETKKLRNIGFGILAAVALCGLLYIGSASSTHGGGSVGGGFFLDLLVGGGCIGYTLFSLPFGWAAFNKITPRIFLFLPIIGWLIYFYIKFLIAVMIGIFVAPYRLAKSKKIEKAIQGIDHTPTIDGTKAELLTPDAPTQICGEPWTCPKCGTLNIGGISCKKCNRTYPKNIPTL